MPFLFQGCTTTNPSNKLMTCCLNTKGDGKKCAPCRRCTFRRGEWRCSKTTCMDSKLCHIHYKLRFGVKLVDTQFGKGVVAEKYFHAGDLIVPMGGKKTTELSWEDSDGVERNSPYGYSINGDFVYNLQVRNGNGGYILRNNVKETPVSWRNASKRNRRQFRRAFIDSSGKYMYMVSLGDWDIFLNDVTMLYMEGLPKRKQTAAYRHNFKKRVNMLLADEIISQLLDPKQFEVRLEMLSLPKNVVYDASCIRRVGSYVNDAADITQGEGQQKIIKQNLTMVNAIILGNSPFPMQQGSWLMATKKIKKGDPILLSYGIEYWQDYDVKHKLMRVAANKTETFPVVVGKQYRPQNEACTIK